MTPQRWSTLNRVLNARQPDLTVLLDNVHKPHNLSAILRTCDAVGVLTAHAVWPNPKIRPSGGIAAGADKWVPVRTHDAVASAIGQLRAQGFQVLAATQADQAQDYRRLDYTRATAFVLGAELFGVSAAACAAADQAVYIPMHGMVESLNVSVAAATLLFEAQRQRLQAGCYAASRLDADTRRAILFEWAHPKVADYCRRHRLPYPDLDRQGELIGAPPPIAGDAPPAAVASDAA